jgi:hypothetical protein
MTRSELIKRINGLEKDLMRLSFAVSDQYESSQDSVTEKVQAELDEAKHDLATGNYEVVGY